MGLSSRLNVCSKPLLLANQRPSAFRILNNMTKPIRRLSTKVVPQQPFPKNNLSFVSLQQNGGGLLSQSQPRLSGKTKLKVHPKYKVHPGLWYMSPRGASKFKAHYTIPYQRLNTTSLYHFPEVSKVTGKPIDWLYDTPKSGYLLIFWLRII